jgi:hypothetical protein
MDCGIFKIKRNYKINQSNAHSLMRKLSKDERLSVREFLYHKKVNDESLER